MRALAGDTFAAFASANYRRYFAGQAVSLIGTWMQTVAQGWLVLEITGSGTALGLVAAAQFTPLLLLAPYGGVLVDRMDKRKLLIFTQSCLGLMALTLGVLTVTGAVELWMIVVLALGLGLMTAIDNPARQSFAQEMVGAGRLRNAVTLNSVRVNAARAVGPAIAGVIIATTGTGICFLVNAVSYAAVLAALISMDVDSLRPTPRAERGPGQVRQGLRYVAHTPDLLVPLIMLAVVGTLTYEFQVVLPLLARSSFDGGAGTYGMLTSAMGAGAIVGGLVAASRGGTGLRSLTLAAAAFGTSVLVTAAAPTAEVAVAALFVVGATSVTFLATGNTTLQLAADPRFRGRVMALWAVAFLGSTPLGAPIIGAIACLLAAAVGAIAITRREPARMGGEAPV